MSLLNQWFQVDKEGLAQVLARGSISWILFELLQNSWDERVKNVKVTLTPVAGRALAELEVDDDSPDGFVHLQHSWTLYAHSGKKSNPTKRGRFNIGEKRVLALCDEARIFTTTGSVNFNPDGTRTVSTARKRPAGTLFRALIRITREECRQLEADALRVIPPAGVHTTFNGKVIPDRVPIATFSLELPTEIASADGALKRTKRVATIRLYEPAKGEEASLFEMGIPVVATGDRWHVDVGQKIPQNSDRDNVSPAYLQSIRVGVLNYMHDRLTRPEDATADWVRSATGDERVAAAAVGRVLDLRFGVARVSYDLSDVEANKLALSEGYTVVTGGSLSAAEWQQAKRAGVITRAGLVTPSQPLNKEAAIVVPPEEISEGMRTVAAFCQVFAQQVLDRSPRINVTFINNPNVSTLASFGSGHLTFNIGRLGRRFFDEPAFDEIIKLVIHEFGHDFSDDHLSRAYHDALCLIAARSIRVALTTPQLFATIPLPLVQVQEVA